MDTGLDVPTLLRLLREVSDAGGQGYHLRLVDEDDEIYPLTDVRISDQSETVFLRVNAGTGEIPERPPLQVSTLLDWLQMAAEKGGCGYLVVLLDEDEEVYTLTRAEVNHAQESVVIQVDTRPYELRH
jgi:hypothetical protein